MAEKENNSREKMVSSGDEIYLNRSLYPSGNFAIVSEDMLARLVELDNQRLPKEKRLPIVLNGTIGIGIEVLLGTRKSNGAEITLISFGPQKIDLIGCKQRSFKDTNHPENILYVGTSADTRVMSGFSFMMSAPGGEQLTVTGVENGIKVGFKHKPTP